MEDKALQNPKEVAKAQVCSHREEGEMKLPLA
jgi:hypothetical protein